MKKKPAPETVDVVLARALNRLEANGGGSLRAALQTMKIDPDVLARSA